jgi:hypothetical protein
VVRESEKPLPQGQGGAQGRVTALHSECTNVAQGLLTRLHAPHGVHALGNRRLGQPEVHALHMLGAIGVGLRRRQACGGRRKSGMVGGEVRAPVTYM